MNNEKILDISWGAIFKIAVTILIFYIIYQIQNVLIWLLFALIISILFDPIIGFLQKLKIPRILATLFVYISFFGIFILSVFLTIPFFISEIQEFPKILQILPQYFEKISPSLKGLEISAFKDFDSFVSTLNNILGKIIANAFNILFIIFGGIFATIFILTAAFFLSLEEKRMEKALILFSPKKYEDVVLTIWQRCQKRISGWFFTRIIACLFVGILSYISFLVFDTSYKFSLALLSAFFNFIPYIGPVITGILIFIIVAIENFSKAIFVLIAFVLIQQIENNILTPFLSKKIIGLSPILVLSSLTIGGTLFGFLGAILAVPLIGILFEFFKEFLEKRKKENASFL